MKPWNQSLSAFVSAVLLVGSAKAVEVDYACYGATDALQCSQHSLQCQEGTIFVTSAQRIFLLDSNSCDSQATSCNADRVNTCCRDNSYYCWEYYSDEALTRLVDLCWNRRNCTYTVQKATKRFCRSVYKNESGYSRLRYLCLPAATTPSTTPVTDLSTTESHTADSGERTETTRPADVQSSSTPHPPVVSTSDVTAENVPQVADRSTNTAGIVGGVVGGLLVLLLVVALVVTFVCLKRRGANASPFPRVAAWFKGGNSSRSRGNSGHAEPHVTYAQPTSLPVYDNSMAAITDEAGVRVDPLSDYNHLGQKPTSSASHDVTYGHLADGSDVTDYGYDHVTKGKPAVRSGDVIDNVYNTAGPATGGSCDEDFYNTTSTAKNRPDVINNVYNTPSSGTEASSDVDYYNTAGLAQSGCDVINNVYDIPKSATAPGPSEIEASDVTGANVSSPYEFASAVK